jgi:hypothetical protein
VVSHAVRMIQEVHKTEKDFMNPKLQAVLLEVLKDINNRVSDIIYC